MIGKNRQAIFNAVNVAGRELGTSSVLFHSVVAENFGLSVTDWRAWDVVMRNGPLTAGRFAELTGLTRGAVTGLIDRLAAAGAVRRVPDPCDRRKVLVESIDQAPAQRNSGEIFNPLMAATAKLYAGYSDRQLALIAEFMTRMAALLREQTANLAPALRAKRKAEQYPSQHRSSPAKRKRPQ